MLLEEAAQLVDVVRRARHVARPEVADVVAVAAGVEVVEAAAGVGEG